MAEQALYGKEASRLDVLIEGRGSPETVGVDDTLDHALEVMFEHDYSQLPVVGSEDRPVGMLTQRGVLRTISHLQARPAHLRVRDAMEDRHAEFIARNDVSVWSVLDRFERISALLVVDEADVLVGIVTDHDTTAYLRQRSEDILAVQDIEETLKQLIRDAYERANGSDLDGDVAQLLQRQWSQDVQKVVRAAISDYGGPTLDKGLQASAIKAAIEQSAPSPRQFDQLSFAQYQILLLGGASWSRYEPHVSFEKGQLSNILTVIGKTRNDLAHLRGGLDRRTRDQLAWFKGWLERTLFVLVEAPPEAGVCDVDAESPTWTEPPSLPPEGVSADDEQADAEETEDAGQGPAFLPLTALLNRRRVRRLDLSFAEIEAELPEALPVEARQHRSWWSNLAAHADAWLSAGYSVTGAFIGSERVRFVRDQPLGRRYLEFFQQLAQALGEAGAVEFEPKSTSWNRLCWIEVEGHDNVDVSARFDKRGGLHVRLNLDVGDADANRLLFDHLLAQRTALTARVGQEMSWLPLDHRRACVIAIDAPTALSVHRPGDHVALVEWAVDGVPRFIEAMGAALGQRTPGLEKLEASVGNRTTTAFAD